VSLHVIAVGDAWTIDENNTPDAYLLRLRDGRYVLDEAAGGGVWILRDGVAYSLDSAGQPFMAVSSEIITASTSAVPLNEAATTGVTLLLKNTSANAADLGGATVTAAAGYGLAASATLTVALKPGDVLYAIRSAGSDATIAVLRT
jgi:hypothetical protein